MSDRLTKANVETRCRSLNERMRARKSAYQYEVGYRNGYCALDRRVYDAQYAVNGRSGWFMHSHVTAGTKTQVGEFLHAMMVALDDARVTS